MNLLRVVVWKHRLRGFQILKQLMMDPQVAQESSVQATVCSNDILIRISQPDLAWVLTSKQGSPPRYHPTTRRGPIRFKELPPPACVTSKMENTCFNRCSRGDVPMVHSSPREIRITKRWWGEIWKTQENRYTCRTLSSIDRWIDG